MNDEYIARIKQIQQEQYQSIVDQDFDSLAILEQEKTHLLQSKINYETLTSEQKNQLQVIHTRQMDLGQIIGEIRDELGNQVGQVIQRKKALKAYRDLDV